MARKNAAIIAASLLGAFAIGLLLGRAIAPDSGSRGEPNSQPVVASDPRGGDAPRRSFQTPRGENAERPEAEVIEGFAFRRLILDTGEDLPKACFQFTEELDDSGDTNYADYVRVSPETGFAVEVNGSSLCLTGLAFDQDYSARLRAGLPSRGGERLEAYEDVTVAFGDKPAYVGFAGDGVVLPRFEADGVGIETVNVEKIDVSVYRVSDRSIARKNMVAGESSGENRYSYVWEGEDGADVGVKVWNDEIDVVGERNQIATTVFALGAALDELKAGAYFIRVRDVSPGANERRSANAWRWIMFTDMALTTFSGADGIDVFVRSISNARPVSGVELSLIATNNDILATAITNADGRAKSTRR